MTWHLYVVDMAWCGVDMVDGDVVVMWHFDDMADMNVDVVLMCAQHGMEMMWHSNDVDNVDVGLMWAGHGT